MKKGHALASRAERARVAREPGHYAAQLVGAPNAAERVQARPLVQQVRLRIKVCCGHAAKRTPVSFSRLLNDESLPAPMFMFGRARQGRRPKPPGRPLASLAVSSAFMELTRRAADPTTPPRFACVGRASVGEPSQGRAQRIICER